MYSDIGMINSTYSPTSKWYTQSYMCMLDMNTTTNSDSFVPWLIAQFQLFRFVRRDNLVAGFITSSALLLWTSNSPQVLGYP